LIFIHGVNHFIFPDQAKQSVGYGFVGQGGDDPALEEALGIVKFRTDLKDKPGKTLAQSGNFNSHKLDKGIMIQALPDGGFHFGGQRLYLYRHSQISYNVHKLCKLIQQLNILRKSVFICG
jgi:hypothetical protein